MQPSFVLTRPSCRCLHLLWVSIYAVLCSVTPLLSAPLSQTPAPPVGVILEPVDYDPGKNEYTLTIRLAGAEFVNKLQMIVAEAEGGRRVAEASGELIVDRRIQLKPTINGQPLQAGRKYTIWIRAVDHYGEFILKRDEEGRPEGDDPTLLAQTGFTHEPQQDPQSIVFGVKGARPDYQTGQIVITLDITRAEAERIREYTVEVKEKESSLLSPYTDAVLSSRLLVNENNEFAIDMPPEMKEPDRLHTYVVTVKLVTDDAPPALAVLEEFTPNLPEQPGFWQKLLNNVSANPWILVTFVLLLLSAPAYYAMHRLQEARRLDLPPRPPMGGGTAVSSARNRSQGAGLFLTVLETPARADKQQHTLSRFPCTIGRQDCDVNFPGDEHLSRTHLQVARTSGAFTITDQGSRNGTFVDGQRLAPGQPFVMRTSTELLLGKRTRVRIEPLD